MRRVCVLLVCAVLCPLGSAVADHSPDLILHSGKVFTAEPSQPWAEAVAVRGPRILAVGDDATVLPLAGPDTRSLDLGGRVVVPGFNDSHAHLGVGFPRLTLPPIDIPGPGPTLAAALGQVAQAVPLAAPGEWILALVGETLIQDPAADRVALDAVATDNPVMLLTWSSHSAVVNSAALARLGVSEEEPDPFGGAYGRFDGTQTVDGRIHEYALFRAFRAIRDEVPDAVLTAEFEAITSALVQLGYTSVQEMTIGLTRERSERVLGAAELPLRLRSICVPMVPAEPCRAAPGPPWREPRFSGIKWLTDGTPIERSAALNEPWVDFPGSGRLNVGVGPLVGIARRSLHQPPRRGQLLLHAVGDRAIDTVLQGLEWAAPAPLWRLRRPRIEHGDLMLREDQVTRVRQLGVVVVQNPTHLTVELEPSLGPVRAAAAQPLRSLLDDGVHLALGSDSTFPNPFVDLFFAVIHPFHPGEALTMEQAVTAYTRGSAFAELEEGRKGTLRAGRLADLAVLSQDIFTVPPPAVPETVSLLTLVGGEVVWDAAVLVP